MEDANSHDREVVDLVVQLCTRIGMMMEDAGPLALNASREGLSERVAELARAIRPMVSVVEAAKSLLGH
jgi:hypothetical protein